MMPAKLGSVPMMPAKQEPINSASQAGACDASQVRVCISDASQARTYVNIASQAGTCVNITSRAEACVNDAQTFQRQQPTEPKQSRLCLSPLFKSQILKKSLTAVRKMLLHCSAHMLCALYRLYTSMFYTLLCIGAGNYQQEFTMKAEADLEHLPSSSSELDLPPEITHAIKTGDFVLLEYIQWS